MVPIYVAKVASGNMSAWDKCDKMFEGNMHRGSPWIAKASLCALPRTNMHQVSCSPIHLFDTHWSLVSLSS